ELKATLGLLRQDDRPKGEGLEPAPGLARLPEQFGWPAKALVDLGGIRGARGVEMYGPFYFAMSAALGTFDFNIAIVRA
ncbi:hypothetical protein ACFWQ6_18510, partial [Streptomyces coelicoflavus]